MRKILVLAFLLFATTCLADNFRIEGTLTSPYTYNPAGTFSGWFSVDTRNGAITNWNINMPSLPAALNEPAMSAFNFSPAFSTFYFSSSNFVVLSVDHLFELAFGIPNKTLIGLTEADFDGSYGESRSRPAAAYLANGTITSIEAPEPSSLLLMGSGVAGILALRRKVLGGDR